MSEAIADYDFALPPTLIAQRPPSERGGSRLLDVDGGDRILPFAALPDLLTPGDVLVVNDSRVLPARLIGRKPGGGRVEILLERLLDEHRLLAQLGSARPLPMDMRITTAGGDFIVLGRENVFYRLLAVDDNNQAADAKRRFLLAGQTPLPPYIRRPPEAADEARYQTVYARADGSVAAPTAGLHFSRDILAAAQQRGGQIVRLTLHVGAGTFAPLRDALRQTTLHSERYHIGKTAAATINAAKRRGRRVIAVGTTVLRALEAAALAGGGEVRAMTAETDLFIRPGFNFQIADVLLTNFHLPQSSLFILVCAFGGRQRVLSSYRRAIRRRLHFYSYGDAMLLGRDRQC